MRYQELTGPLKGWTYDELGTIHTASGYACDARTIECALWLLQCYGREVRKYLIHSDEAAGALRPLYEPSDVDVAIPPSRLRGALARWRDRPVRDANTQRHPVPCATGDRVGRTRRRNRDGGRLG